MEFAALSLWFFITSSRRIMSQNATWVKGWVGYSRICLLTYIKAVSSTYEYPVIKTRILRASLIAQFVMKPPAIQETWVWSLGWEDPLEEGKATHSSILVYSPRGCKELDTAERLSLSVWNTPLFQEDSVVLTCGLDGGGSADLFLEWCLPQSWDQECLAVQVSAMRQRHRVTEQPWCCDFSASPPKRRRASKLCHWLRTV